MPGMSRKYCLTTSPRKMGFSQKASCKAQGLLKRTSKANKGKYVVSKKYKRSRKKSKRKSRKRSNRKYDGSAASRKKVNKSLYYNGTKKPRVKSGYGTEERAKQTLRNLKGKDKLYQYQVVNTMYNRAKYHANQTKGMREAMKVYKKWLDKQKKKSKRSKRSKK